jgi:hypothetical protein
MAKREVTGVVVEIVRESTEQQWKDMQSPKTKSRVDVAIHPDDDSLGIAAIILRTNGRWAEGIQVQDRVRLTIGE